jgi:GDP-mannose 6-dehydrogenase
LTYRAGQLDLRLPLLQSAMPSNEQHLKRAIEAVLDLPAKRLGVIGLAFKEDTDDLRESPVVTLLEQLIGKGRDLKVFDPHIRLDAIYGANRNFILETIPHIGRLLVTGIDQVLGWSDHLVVAQKQSAEITEQIAASGLPVVNLVRGSLKCSVALSRMGN